MSSSALERALAALDSGLQTPMPDPSFGEISPTVSGSCARCERKEPVSGGDLCSGCRAFLLEDSDVDPAAVQARWWWEGGSDGVEHRTLEDGTCSCGYDARSVLSRPSMAPSQFAEVNEFLAEQREAQRRWLANATETYAREMTARYVSQLPEGSFISYDTLSLVERPGWRGARLRYTVVDEVQSMADAYERANGVAPDRFVGLGRRGAVAWDGELRRYGVTLEPEPLRWKEPVSPASRIADVAAELPETTE